MHASSELAGVNSPTAISPLPSFLSSGLLATGFFGFVSAVMTMCLIARLVYKLAKQRSARTYPAQVLWLIFSLVCADCVEALGFLLSIVWLQRNAIAVGTPECWTQAWFLCIGNVSIGIFTFSIACHTFSDLVCNYRLPQRAFFSAIVALWAFTCILAVIGITSHRNDFYTRAGAWCWINAKYSHDRLYLHYIWIMAAEFGTIIVYGALFIILQCGYIHRSYHAAPRDATRARRAAKAIILYPLIYIICTLPLVVARISSIAGRPVGYVQQCVAGAMLASTGWLDVLMYCLTRHALIFGDEDAVSGMRALDTFDWGPDEFGTRTLIEAVPVPRQRSFRRRRNASRRRLSGLVELSAHDGMDDMHPAEIRMVITTQTEVQIRTAGRV